MGSNSSRIIIDICLVLSIFILPWWLVFIFICGASFRFESFYEGLFLSLMIDIIYFIPHRLFYNLPVVFILFFFMFLLISFFGKQLRINHQ